MSLGWRDSAPRFSSADTMLSASGMPGGAWWPAAPARACPPPHWPWPWGDGPAADAGACQPAASRRARWPRPMCTSVWLATTPWVKARAAACATWHASLCAPLLLALHCAAPPAAPARPASPWEQRHAAAAAASIMLT